MKTRTVITAVITFFRNPHRAWCAIFASWTFMLTGVFYSLTGSTGLLQWFSMNRLLNQKQAELAQLEQEIEQIESEAKRIETNPYVQEKEIRRVLGYVAQDEIVFDFSMSQSKAISK